MFTIIGYTWIRANVIRPYAVSADREINVHAIALFRRALALRALDAGDIVQAERP
jgi:hypothetical protein